LKGTYTAGFQARLNPRDTLTIFGKSTQHNDFLSRSLSGPILAA